MLWLPIDRTSEISLTRQIYNHLHKQILSGVLPAGEQLPASRALAAILGVSRNVVLQAYDQLLAEGYIEGRHGSGTFVAQGAYLQPSSQESSLFEPTISPTAKSAVIDFRSGVPALDQFPRQLWGKLTKQVCATMSHTLFGYGSPQGCSELRTVLAKYLLRTIAFSNEL